MLIYYLGNNDIFLMKYSSAGLVVWTRQAGSAEDDVGQSVAVSGDGSSIYVSGFTSGALNGQTNAGWYCQLQLL